MPTLKQAHDQFTAKSDEAWKFYNSFPEVDGQRDMKKEDVEKFQTMYAEVDALGKEYETLKTAEVSRRNLEAQRDGLKAHDPTKPLIGEDNQGREQAELLGMGRQRKDVGDLLVESKDFRDQVAAYKQKGGKFSVTVEMPDASFKATLVRSPLTGYDRAPAAVMVGTQRLMITDLIAQGTTTQPTVRYLRETSYTNAATTVAEEGLKPEATFVLAEVDAPVKKIAVIAKVTDEMWADFPQIQAYVNERLRFMVEEREEAQVLNGNGVGSNLLGIMQTPTVQTQAKGGDPFFDAIYKAFTKIRTVGYFEPDGYVTHPNDWQEVVLTRTIDGIYILGNPADPQVERIWGKPVVSTTAITEGTGLAGAFRMGAQLFRRTGVTIESTNSNEDDFKYNRIALRAELREALAVYRPLAFCLVTGM